MKRELPYFLTLSCLLLIISLSRGYTSDYGRYVFSPPNSILHAGCLDEPAEHSFLQTDGPRDTSQLQGDDDLPDMQQAEDRLSITLQYRPRSEYRDGYRKPMSDSLNPAIVTNQRSRIGLSYQHPRFRSRISFQDIRTWGETRIKQDVSSFLLHEAWFEVFVNSSLSLKLGRQVLKYADQRFLAACNWNNVGSTHDMALLKYERPSRHLHFGMAYNNETSYLHERYNDYPDSFYKTMQFMWFSQDLGPRLEASFLEITDGRQKEGSDRRLYFRTTMGINLDYGSGEQGLALSGKGYWQGGKIREQERVNAYFLAFKATYSWNRLALTLGSDYYSGDNGLDTTDRVNGAFNNLYGSGHGYYGSMDYFRTIDKHTLGGGLHDIYGKVAFRISGKTRADLTYHHFSLASQVADPTQPAGRLKALDQDLGSELDFSLNHTFSKNFQVKMGYSLMFGTDSLAAIKGGNTGHVGNWGFVMLTFQPEVFVNNLNINQ
jgi:hypothetical protein